MRARKIVSSIRLRSWFGCLLALGLVLGLGWAALPLPEPRWAGHSLSEWLDAHDTNWRFDEGDGRRSRFNDEEIDQALDGIGPAALPFLRQWLTAKPSRVKACINRLLNRQAWVSFRFQEADRLQCLAETGFMVYGTDAQPLLPELLELSHSPDANVRMLAYEAAFFTRPPREIFLPLAARALEEQDWNVRAMAAQRMRERFSSEVEQTGLRDQFPARFVEAQANSPD